MPKWTDPWTGENRRGQVFDPNTGSWSQASGSDVGLGSSDQAWQNAGLRAGLQRRLGQGGGPAKWASDTVQANPGWSNRSSDPNNLWDQGAAERQWAKYEDYFSDPSNRTSSYVDQNMGAFKRPGDRERIYDQAQAQYGLGGTGYSRDALKAAQGLSQNLTPYYDYAFNTGQDQINKAMAARGMFNSQAANREIGNLSANLGAQRANAEGQYGLSRAGLIGNLAGQADSQARSWMDSMAGMAGQSDQGMFDRITGGATFANMGDQAEQSKMSTGMTMANMAQGANENRVMGMLDQTQIQDQGYAAIAAAGYGDLIDRETGAIDAEAAMRMGIPREIINQYNRKRESDQADWGSALKIFEMFGAGGGG